MISLSLASEACGRMSAMKFFPAKGPAWDAIGDQLMRMVEHGYQLDWLIDAMLDKVGEWPGTRELRAVYCTRYRPADGIEEWSGLSGFSAADSERRYIESGRGNKVAELEAPRKGAMKQIGGIV